MADAQWLRHDAGLADAVSSHPEPAAAAPGTDDAAGGFGAPRPWPCFAPARLPRNEPGHRVRPAVANAADTRARAGDPPSWWMWRVIALSLLVLSGVAAGLST
jgi:hypothetical protein